MGGGRLLLNRTPQIDMLAGINRRRLERGLSGLQLIGDFE